MPLNPTILLLGVYFTEIKAQVHKAYLRMLTAALFIIIKLKTA